MKHTLQQVFHSPKFVVGFIIFMFIVLTVIVYPILVKAKPLGIIGQGTFFPPGIYVSTFDSVVPNNIHFFWMMPRQSASPTS